MKKLYFLLIVCLAAGITAQAQFTRRAKGKTHIPVNALSQQQQHQLRSKGQPSQHQINSVLWSDEFTTPANWTVNHSVGTGDWQIGFNPPAGPAAIDSINSASAANGYATFDSDLYCDTSQIADMTTANPINLSGHPNVRLKFSQYYRRYVDSTFVFVSNNGTSWTKFVINKDLQPFQYNDKHIGHNPARVELNISSVAGNQDSVWVRFEFYSPGSLGGGAGCGYAWMVDDASISDIDSTDGKLAMADGGEYTLLPLIQTESFKLRGKIINNGLAPISGGKINFELYDSNFNQLYTDSTAASGTIAPGDSSAFLNAIGTPYILSDTGLYYIQQTLYVPGDTTTNNDVRIGVVYVTDSIYGRDYTAIDGDLADQYGFPTPGFPNGGAFGQIYHINAASEATSATFLLTNPQLGARIRVSLFEVNNGTPLATAIGSSADYTITSADTAVFDFKTLAFQTPISVTPGDYLLAITQLDTNFLWLATSTDIFTPGTTFFRSAQPTWSPLNLGQSFLLRLNNPSSTLNGIAQPEKSELFYVYPNPSNGIIHIVGGDEKNVRVSVISSLGQIVKTEFHEMLHSTQMDLSNLPSGIYTVNIHTASSDVNKTIVLK